jgi:hypothetical protein
MAVAAKLYFCWNRLESVLPVTLRRRTGYCVYRKSCSDFGAKYFPIKFRKANRLYPMDCLLCVQSRNCWPVPSRQYKPETIIITGREFAQAQPLNSCHRLVSAAVLKGLCTTTVPSHSDPHEATFTELLPGVVLPRHGVF